MELPFLIAAPSGNSVKTTVVLACSRHLRNQEIQSSAVYADFY
jgi:hypothetical protein